MSNNSLTYKTALCDNGISLNVTLKELSCQTKGKTYSAIWNNNTLQKGGSEWLNCIFDEDFNKTISINSNQTLEKSCSLKDVCGQCEDIIKDNSDKSFGRRLAVSSSWVKWSVFGLIFTSMII
jgi:hypothetical protein